MVRTQVEILCFVGKAYSKYLQDIAIRLVSREFVACAVKAEHEGLWSLLRPDGRLHSDVRRITVVLNPRFRSYPMDTLILPRVYIQTGVDALIVSMRPVDVMYSKV